MSGLGDESLAATPAGAGRGAPALLLAAWAPVALWMALIVSLSNDRFSDVATAGWLSGIMRAFGVSPAVVEAGNLIVRKCAHFVEYAALGLLTVRAARATRPQRRGRQLVAIAALVAAAGAIADELYQHLATLSRTGAPKDVALDVAGALVGAAGAILYRSWRARRAA